MEYKLSIKHILLFLTTCIFFVSIQAQTRIPIFRKGERVIFVGNSITHGGHYHSFIWLYYMTRFPNKPVYIMNGGIGGECVWDIKDRLNCDVFNRNPTYVILTFGMNDTGYDIFMKENADDLSSQRIVKSLESFHEIEKYMITRDDVNTVLIGGSPYDETSKFNDFILKNKNKAIETIIENQRTVAKKNGWGFVDFNKPMCDISVKEQAKDSTFTFCRVDRIHPDNDGQMVMAYLFLKAQGLAGKDVASVSLDASKLSVIQKYNCKISRLKKYGDELSYDYLAYSLPYPLDSISRSGWGNHKSQRDAMKLIPFMEEFNKEYLQVSNLEEGLYQLSIDNQVIKVFSSDELAKGVNLADFPNTPQYQQAAKIMYLNEERFEVEKRFREYLWTEFTYLKDNGLLFVDNLKAIEKLKVHLSKDVFLKMSYDWFVKAMNPEIREVWNHYMNYIIKTIYKINKPIVHKVTLKKIYELK